VKGVIIVAAAITMATHLFLIINGLFQQQVVTRVVYLRFQSFDDALEFRV
jgi:hypothetical protein